ncbi:MAG: response regulator [Sphingobacteriales bacterium]|nr:MAG: response regulator [Sphingobacteriales bacterium]
MATQSNRYMFLVDDEPIQNEMLKDYLSERFLYNIKIYDNAEEALRNMNLNPEIVVLDYHLNAHKPDAMNGVDGLKKIKESYPQTQVIMLSGQDKIEVATESMKFGAYDYVVKGEAAFPRMENILNNVSELHRAHTINSAYKKTIAFLAVVIALIIVLAIYLYMTGAYASL